MSLKLHLTCPFYTNKYFQWLLQIGSVQQTPKQRYDLNKKYLWLAAFQSIHTVAYTILLHNINILPYKMTCVVWITDDLNTQLVCYSDTLCNAPSTKYNVHAYTCFAKQHNPPPSVCLCACFATFLSLFMLYTAFFCCCVDYSSGNTNLFRVVVFGYLLWRKHI